MPSFLRHSFEENLASDCYCGLCKQMQRECLLLYWPQKKILKQQTHLPVEDSQLTTPRTETSSTPRAPTLTSFSNKGEARALGRWLAADNFDDVISTAVATGALGSGTASPALRCVAV